MNFNRRARHLTIKSATRTWEVCKPGAPQSIAHPTPKFTEWQPVWVRPTREGSSTNSNLAQRVRSRAYRKIPLLEWVNIMRTVDHNRHTNTRDSHLSKQPTKWREISIYKGCKPPLTIFMSCKRKCNSHRIWTSIFDRAWIASSRVSPLSRKPKWIPMTETEWTLA